MIDPAPANGYMRQCHCDCGGLRWGWVEYRKVGPNLPQRSIRFTCANCKTERSCGLIYRYPDTDSSQGGQR